ncbi:hypothetical protein [Brenneria corticis]|uniref:Uncharacterized protein n=1 Tax=Brenneria corticis TaxID=2173106 RepID=A0A2U1UB05_9GAMM|nr:hypothetical protein [Brenneria sp. CFCC 11842]PWC18792.1 hypothetical protein DDT56_02175 [Brenneria sp. CFCC 11842]
MFELIRHGREIDAAIASNDQTLLARSSEALESYFDKPAQELPRQNAFPVALMLFFFLLSFTLSLLFFLDLFAINTPPLHVVLFFIPSILLIIYLFFASYLLSRGHNTGLVLYYYFFIAILALGVFQLFYSFVDAMNAISFSFDTLTTSIIVLLSVFLSRALMNSRPFAAFVLYCRTQRMATQSRKLRMEARNR